jgi:hypothetical protein
MCCKVPLNFDRLVFIAVGFMIMFSGYITVQGLATKVLEDNNFGKLGFYCMGL